MKKRLHILNGDGTAGGFSESNMQGDVIVWREMLCEGPVNEMSVPEAFWEERKKYLSRFGGKKAEDFYTNHVLSEIKRLRAAEDYDEIILWFEFDLFCQVNLLFLLSWFHLQSESNSHEIYLVCPKDHPEIENFMGMGQLSPTQLEGLFETRIKLGDDDLATGHQVWKAYQAKDPRILESLLSTDFGPLDCLKNAILLHLERFPSIATGLSRIERKLLGFLEHQPQTFGEIFNKFCKEESGYGFGDLQIKKSLENLMPEFVTFNNEYVLTDQGESCLKGETDFLKIKIIEGWIGGYRKNSGSVFRFDNKQNRLVTET